MNSIPIDIDRETMVYLLRKLSLGRLDKEEAMLLIPLLKKELIKAEDNKNITHVHRLLRLLDKLSLYVKGQINLMPAELNKINLSNVK